MTDVGPIGVRRRIFKSGEVYQFVSRRMIAISLSTARHIASPA